MSRCRGNFPHVPYKGTSFTDSDSPCHAPRGLRPAGFSIVSPFILPRKKHECDAWSYGSHLQGIKREATEGNQHTLRALGASRGGPPPRGPPASGRLGTCRESRRQALSYRKEEGRTDSLRRTTRPALTVRATYSLLPGTQKAGLKTPYAPPQPHFQAGTPQSGPKAPVRTTSRKKQASVNQRMGEDVRHVPTG